MPQVGCQVLKFRHSLFYFRRVGETGSDAHQIQAMPLGGANCRDNYAITGALSYALGNARVRGSHCLPDAAAIKSSIKINKSSADIAIAA